MLEGNVVSIDNQIFGGEVVFNSKMKTKWNAL
jgi:hypothetical protein